MQNGKTCFINFRFCVYKCWIDRFIVPLLNSLNLICSSKNIFACIFFKMISSSIFSDNNCYNQNVENTRIICRTLSLLSDFIKLVLYWSDLIFRPFLSKSNKTWCNLNQKKYKIKSQLTDSSERKKKQQTNKTSNGIEAVASKQNW